MDNEGSSPMQVDPATESLQIMHEQSQHIQEHVHPGQSLCLTVQTACMFIEDLPSSNNSL